MKSTVTGEGNPDGRTSFKGWYVAGGISLLRPHKAFKKTRKNPQVHCRQYPYSTAQGKENKA